MAWTSPRTWVAGETVTAAICNTHIRDNFKAIGDPWTAYTPTWTSTGTAPAIVNGTIAGAWIQVGKLIHFRLRITLGSSSTAGTGSYGFGLPTPAINASEDAMNVSGAAINAGVSWVPCHGRRSTFGNTAIELIYLSGLGAGALVTATAPHAPGNLDIYTASGTYEAA